jgi:hypothetical protein
MAGRLSKTEKNAGMLLFEADKEKNHARATFL